MDSYSDFIQFSRDLCAFNIDIPFSDEEEEFLDSYDFLSSADSVLDVFRDAFCSRFGRLYKLNYSQVLDTEERFFIYTIPRCLNLVDDDHYYFSLMLVAAFITELVDTIQEERDCFRFIGTAYKCLLAIFKRRFEDNFEKKGGWRGLEAFIDGYADWYTQTKHRRLANFLTRGGYEHTRRVLHLIKESDTALVEGFSLNEYELSLIAMDNQLSIEAEINKSMAESGDFLLQMESDVQKDNGVENNQSKSITHLEKCVSNFPSKPLNSESSSHANLISRSLGSESPITDTSPENEKLSSSNDCKESEFNAKNIHALNKSIAESRNTPLQIECDSQKDNRVDELAESVTLEGNCVPNYPAKPLSCESFCDSDSLWESSDSESSDTDTSFDDEKLSNSECSKLESSANNVDNSHEDVRERRSDSDNSSECLDSDSVSQRNICITQLSEDLLAERYPKIYGKTLAERTCTYCNKMCYEYSKYFVRKHRDSALNRDKASKNEKQDD